MDVLIIGGSSFLGPHLIDALNGAGHRVTAFNRGLRRSSPPAGVEFIKGDRDRDLHLLEGRMWDAVIDTCGFVPRVVAKSVRALEASAVRYAFVSTLSVYAEPLGGRYDEEEPLATLADPTTEEVTNEAYGALKALSEREVRGHFGDRALIIRPGLIVGPLDPTDRFTYWPWRFSLGGDVLVPGSPQRSIAPIDVRDLARWIVAAIERGVAGTYNATGDPTAATMSDLVQACRAASGGIGTPVWVDGKFLIDYDVTPWLELPLWVPPDSEWIFMASSAKAFAAGLECRPIAQIVADTLAWCKTFDGQHVWKAGLTRERERMLLAEWSRLR